MFCEVRKFRGPQICRIYFQVNRNRDVHGMVRKELIP